MAQPLYRQYLHQARRLANLDPHRPRQGNLRRALSGAYYALFHFLIDQSSRFFVGGVRRRREFRRILVRAYGHGEMAAAARAFRGGSFPSLVIRTLGAVTVPVELRDLAQLFLDVQEQRHLADYDLAVSFLRADVIAIVDQVEKCIEAWTSLRIDPAAEFFLIYLLISDKIRNR